MKNIFKLAACAVVLCSSVISTQASTITFDLTSFIEDPSVTFSSEGLDLTIDNAFDGSGSTINIRNALGGFVASDFASLAVADFSFSQDVRLVSFSVSNDESDGDGAFFNLTQGSVSSLANPVDVIGGPFSFSNLFDVFRAGSPIEFLVGDAVDDLTGASEFEAFALSSITVDTNISAVPLPMALPLLGSSLAFFGFLGWRRKQNDAARTD